jgi:hypothetical protein
MGFRWVGLWVLGASALIGCGKKPRVGPTPVVEAAPPVASAVPARAVPSVDARPPEPSPAQTNPEDEPWQPEQYAPALSDEADRLFQRELLVARKAVAEKRYDDAVRHYSKALSTGRNDAQCLGERGYVRLLLRDLPAAVDDLWMAAGAIGSERTLSQVWYNLGLAYAEQAQAELSRVAFARSLAFADSNQAKAKLGTQSRCTAIVRRAVELSDQSGAQLVSGWRGVHEFLGAQGEPKTEAEARLLACSTNSAHNYLVTSPAPSCTGAPPWMMSCCAGMGNFMVRYMMVYPRADDRFFTMDLGMIGGWPRQCQGAPMPEVSVHGKYLVLKTVDAPPAPNADFVSALGVDDGGDAPCRSGPRELEYRVYDLDTAKQVLDVRSLAPGGAKLMFDPAGTKARLQGPDCAATLSLAKG